MFWQLDTSIDSFCQIKKIEKAIFIQLYEYLENITCYIKGCMDFVINILVKWYQHKLVLS